jgi:aspartate racemase
MELHRIGLIGGTTWESTASYYRLLNEAVRDRVGGFASAPVTIWSVDFADIAALQQAGDWPAQGRILADAAKRLQDCGAEAIAVAANTLHLVADDIRHSISVPFVDLIDLTADAAASRGFESVGLLATGYTMRSDLFPARLGARGVEMLVPDEPGMQAVHDIIYRELAHGVVNADSRQRYLAEIDALITRGAQAVILGCTEIGMLLRDGDAPVPLLDTTVLHCAALTDVIINGARQ